MLPNIARWCGKYDFDKDNTPLYRNADGSIACLGYNMGGFLAYSVRSDGYVFMSMRIIAVSWAKPEWKQAA